MTDPIPTIDPTSALTLTELNHNIKQALLDALPDTYWVRAETSEVRVNSYSGHCYLEFIEKDERTGQIAARARATIWARQYAIIRPYFEEETGRPFGSGLKVLVRVAVEYHPLYGLSLTVHDIDPTFTLGDMVRRRKEIVQQLQADGVFDLNRALPLPTLPRRIAVISSATAAGYEDFTHQLLSNDYGFPFYPHLYPALMQGERTESSIIAALDRIYAHRDAFDLVVIIRGGGSTADLSSFDSYALAAHCAQFPLPIITGIGHERDDTVVDLVAHTRLKTPTAVATFLIDCMATQLGELSELRDRLCRAASVRIEREQQTFHTVTTRFPLLVTAHIERRRTEWHRLTARLTAVPQLIERRRTEWHRLSARLTAVPQLLERHRERIDAHPQLLRHATDSLLMRRRHALELTEQHIRLASPDLLLQRGYTLTLRDGMIVKRAASLSPGDAITIRFADGEREGQIV